MFRVLYLSGWLLVLPSLALAASSDTCSSSSTQYLCPSRAEQCGFAHEDAFVTDCLNDCPRFLHPSSGDGNVCVDRRLFQSSDTKTSDSESASSSFLWRDIVGLIVWFLSAGVATACGVGGGGIYVPLGILLLALQPKTSSGLSQASIFGASLGGLMLNSRNRHPDKISFRSREYRRPLIDYDMALFLAPMEMAGAVLGVLVQTILPNWLYLMLAAVILAATAYKTFGKYRSTRASEREREAEADEEEDNEDNNDDEDAEKPPSDTAEIDAQQLKGNSSNDSDEQVSSEGEEVPAAVPLQTNGNTTDNDVVVGASQETPSTEENQECLELLEQDSRQFPREKVLALLILWIGLILLTFFKGGKGVDSLIGITCTSPWYGVLIGIQFVWTLGFAVIFGRKLVVKQNLKTRVGYPSLPNDVNWDNSGLRFYAAFTFLAGIVAGLIGIGGGMVLGPLMLVMGIHPRVSSATTATMIVLTSSSVAILFVTAGLVPWDYAVAFFCTCLVGALVGKTRIDGYVKRTGRSSLLILLLAIIIALATLGCIVIVILRLNEADWCFAGFNKFCSVDDDDSEGDGIVCGADRMLQSLGFLS